MKMFSCFQRKTRRAHFYIICAVLLYLAALPNTSSGLTGSAAIDDLIITPTDESTTQITLKGEGNLNASPAFFDSPPRVVFDFNSTILRFNKGQTKKIQLDKGNLTAVALAQFQINPNIARFVMYFNSGDSKTLLNEIDIKPTLGKVLITYHAGKPRPSADKPKKEKVTDRKQVIEKLFHKRTSMDSDSFILMSPKSIYPSSSKYVTNRLIFNFDTFAFDIPEDSETGNRLTSPISGSVIDELTMINKPEGAVLELGIKKSFASMPIEYQLSYPNSGELRIDVVKSEPEDSSVTIKSVKENKAESFTKDEMTQILGGGGGGDTTLESPVYDALVKIKQIKLLPIADGERFIFEAKDGELKPVFEFSDNPPILQMRIANSNVPVLDKTTRFKKIDVNGEITRELKITNEIVGAIPESIIQFYLNDIDAGLISHKFYKTDNPAVYHLDITKLTPPETTDSIKSPKMMKDEKPDEKALSSLPPIEMGAEDVKYKTPGEVSETGKVVETGSESEVSGNEVVEIPRVVGGEIDKRDQREISSIEDEGEVILKESKQIDTVPIPKSKDKPAMEIKPSTDIMQTPANNPLRPDVFPLGQMFMPSEQKWDDDNLPLMMFILFNKEKSSFVLYMVYLEDGKLKFERFPK